MLTAAEHDRLRRRLRRMWKLIADLRVIRARSQELVEQSRKLHEAPAPAAALPQSPRPGAGDRIVSD